MTQAIVSIRKHGVYLDENEVIPEKATVTVAKKNDRTQMEELVHEPGVTYIFDRGYIDYAAFDRYCRDEIFFVTRLKSNTHIEPLEKMEVPKGSLVAADCLVRIGSQQKKMKHILRMVQTEDSQGNVRFLITNRFDLTCEEMSENIAGALRISPYELFSSPSQKNEKNELIDKINTTLLSFTKSELETISNIVRDIHSLTK